MSDKSILDYLGDKDYKIALMTTFNFEIDFFERFILNRLYDYNIRKISLFIDAKELSKSINNVDNSYIGRKYFVTPIEMNSSFHPKVFLLLGDKKARLIVGSANLTRTGLSSNNEIFNVFDYDEKQGENLALIKSAMSFFKKLHLINETENDLFEEISYIGYLNKEASHEETFLLTNIDKSILEQSSEIIRKEINTIDIAVPYYDNELLALRAIKNKYSDAKINLYIQNKMSTFNVDYNESNNIIEVDNIIPFSKCISNDSTNFYHGKVIRFRTDDESYILYGSANCTLSALVKTYKSNGNIECDVFEKGSVDEFDYFFEDFEEHYTEKLESQVMIYESQPERNYIFKYIEDDITLKVYINYKNKYDDLVIKLFDEELKYTYLEDKIVVLLPLEVLNRVESIFTLNLFFNNTFENIRCWYNNLQAITVFREVSNERSVINVKVLDDGSIFMEDEILIMNAMYDPKEMKLVNLQMKKRQIEADEPDNEDDNFKIDENIPDDYVRKYKEHEYVNNCIRKLAGYYFSGIRRLKEENKNFTSEKMYDSSNDLDDYEKPKVIRKATEPEKRFERLVKNKIEDLLSLEKYEKKSYDEYKNLIGFFFGIFDKYKYQEKIEDIFLDKYVVETKYNLLNVLLSKEEAKNDEYRDDNIIMTLMVILETDYINSLQEQLDYKVETRNKEILKRIDNLYNLRNDFKGYLKYVVEQINERTIEIVKELKSRENDNSPITAKEVYLIKALISENHAINVVDRLYGYKTNQELLDVIKKYYGEESSIEFSDSIISVVCNLDSVGKHLSVENNDALIQMLKEIKNYSKNVNKIDLVKAVINISNHDGLTKLEYTYNYDNQTYDAILSYANGKVIPRSRQLRT